MKPSQSGGEPSVSGFEIIVLATTRRIEGKDSSGDETTLGAGGA
jgi:hypothetical protein